MITSFDQNNLEEMTLRNSQVIQALLGEYNMDALRNSLISDVSKEFPNTFDDVFITIRKGESQLNKLRKLREVTAERWGPEWEAKVM